MKLNQVKSGAVLSYLLIICNSLYGFFITPYIIGRLGDAEYGVYKSIAALAGSVMVLDVGLGNTVMRYIAKYRAANEEYKISEFVSMSIIQAVLLCIVIALVSFVIILLVPYTYANTFTQLQIKKAQYLFIVFSFNMLLHVFDGILSGVITGHNRFVFSNSIKLLRIFIRAMGTVVLLQITDNSLFMVLLDTALVLLFMAVEFVYIQRKFPIKIQRIRPDTSLFFESGKYTVLAFLVSIAYQVGGNLDNVVIGSISGPALVTIYSIGLLIYNMFQNLSMGIAGVMLPTVSKVIENDVNNQNITNFIVRVGRAQFILLGATVIGFICLGKDFIDLWVGSDYKDVYIITIILMLPAMFELCVNTCMAVLRAKNQTGFFTMVMILSAVLNALITIFAVKHWSYIGAAIGTALSVIVGNLIVMNIYFSVKMELPIMRIYGRILSRIWVCLLIAGGTIWITSAFLNGSWIMFAINVLIFCVVYAIGLWLFGLNQSEKLQVPILRRYVK